MPDDGLVFNRCVLGQGQRQTGFAHRRPRRDYHQILLLKTRSQRVKPAKSRGHAGNHHVAMLDGFGFFQHAFRRMLDVLETLANALIGQRKNRVLGVIQNVLRLVFFFQGLGADLVRDLDQLPQQRLSPHDFGELHDAGDVRQSVGQVSQKEHAARRVQRVIAAQLFGDQNRIDFRAALEQRDHRHEDAAMRRHVKVRGLQQLNRLRYQRVV